MKTFLGVPLFAFLPLLISSAGSARTIGPLATTAKPDAAHKSEAIQLTGSEYVIPQLILGGEWTSDIKLSNQGSTRIPTTNVYFYDDQGNPMSATFQTTDGDIVTDTGFSFSLNSGEVIEGSFFGTSATRFGHAVVGWSANGCGTDGLYGEVTLRNRNPTRPDFESVFPFEYPTSLQYLLFDGRKGITTSLYLVNESTHSTTISIDVVDDGNFLLRTVNIPFFGLQSQILTLHVLAPETVGAFGTLVIRSPGVSVPVTATGLRINPSNSFTPLRAFIP